MSSENKEVVVRNYLDEIREIFNSDKTNEEKRELLADYHESDIADILDELEEDERKKLYEILGDETLGEVILYSEDLDEIVEELEPQRLADIIETLDADDAIDVLEELTEEDAKEVLEFIEDEEVVEDIIAISKYDEDVIGSEMSNNFISISINDSVKTAMKKVIKEAGENDNISYIYVLDKEEKLYGVIELRDLIIAREKDNLDDIIKKNYPYFFDNEKIDEIINKIRDYAMDSYPIVDEEMHLLGVFTHDDALDVTYEEFEDDYAKLAGITAEDDVDESLFKSVGKRIPWLIVLLILGLTQSFLMTGFEKVVACLPIIVFFQTLVLGMSGNSGTQSLAVTIRTVSTVDKEKSYVGRTLFREIRVGFLNGLILGILAFLFVFLFLLFTNQGVTTETFDYIEALKAAGIVASSLLISMTISSFIGSLIPIFFKKINIDPAVASGPFITTVNDLTAMLIYYGLAALLFSIVL